MAHKLGAEVIGFAANRLAEMSDQDGNEILKKMNSSESFIFTETFLKHIVYSYKMQLDSIENKLKSNAN